MLGRMINPWEKMFYFLILVRFLSQVWLFSKGHFTHETESM